MSVEGRNLQFAHAYAAAGFPLIPLREGANGGVDKNPGAFLGRAYFDKASNALEKVDEWAKFPQVVGFGLVVPLGIDVDDGRRLNRKGEFVEKSGGATLRMLEYMHGPLTRTFRVSARTDDVNGIRLYRPPEGLDDLLWVRECTDLLSADGDIEIIRPNHRHAFAVGLHPGARPHELSGNVDSGVCGEVRLFGPDGSLLEPSEVPRLCDLPRISEEWFEHIRKRCDHFGRPRGAVPSAARDRGATRSEGPRSIHEAVSGIGLSEEAVGQRFEHLLVDRHGWTRVEPVGGGIAFDHPEATSERSGTVTRGDGDRFRLHLFAGTATLSGTPLPANEQGYSLWDLLLVEAGGDHGEAERLADELDWLDIPDEEGDWFWEQRPLLRHIRDAAHARGVSAPAVLAVVLARFITEVSHRVTLPPLIGGEMSLNTYVALMGPSGAGKTSVMAVVEDLFSWTVDQESVGSGEGLIRGYGSVSKGVWSQDRTSQFLYVDEVVTLTAQTSRSGSTLLGVINAAWTGGALSQQYADAAKRSRIPRHGYRLCMVVGVQLGKADDLLRHSDAGTPQRFIWAPLIDPDIPPPEHAPEWPGLLDLPEIKVPTDSITTPMRIADSIKARIRHAYHRRTTSWDRPAGDRDHDDLLQLKIAAALSLLDGRMDVADEDWGNARVIMRNSRSALQRVRHEHQRRAHGVAKAAGHRQAQRNAVAREVEDRLEQEKAIEQAAGRIARHVHKHAPERDGFCVKKCAKNGLKQAGLLPHFDAAVSLAAERHWIEVRTMDEKRQFLPGAVQPPAGGMG